jgi:hypothetical protein
VPTQILIRKISIKVLSAVVMIALLTSCGTTKSDEVNKKTSASIDPVYVNYQKPLTSCNKTTNSDMSLNINAVTSSSGSINPDWVKIKFNFLSSTATQSGNVIKFFKWKVIGGQSSLDQTPLSVMFYDLSTGQLTSNASTYLSATDVTTTRGAYIQLNDTAGTYQVLKVVVYNSAGQVVAQMNSLIPQFNSNLSDYSTNSDGTARAQILIDIHPLSSVATTGWTQTDYANYFQNFCF